MMQNIEVGRTDDVVGARPQPSSSRRSMKIQLGGRRRRAPKSRASVALGPLPMDPHRVLGVPPGSSDAEVKAAYRKAALRWHPDRHAGSDPATAADAAERFRRASEAFERLSGGGDARGGRGGGAGASGRRPWSSHAAGAGAGSGYGYYNGSDDPFGFRTAESARTGDHMRRINRNIRVLYASLACLGALIYLAPEPPSPVEQAKARRRREMRARGRGEQPALHFVERVNPTLALGSPLYSSDAGKSRPSRTTASRENETLRDGDALGYEYGYAYEGGGDAWDVPGTPGTSRGHRGDDFGLRRGSRAASVGEAEQRAALRGARVVAEGGGAAWRAERERERQNERERAGGEDVLGEGARDFGGGAAAPEWAAGGYAGRGISRRVLPYRGRGDASSREGGAREETLCARCGFGLSPVARFCSICGERTVAPGSVVRRPTPDPQNTGLNVGRGRERARAAEAAAGREEGDG